MRLLPPDTPPGSSEVRRCAWAETDPLLRTYHDSEWGVPEWDGRKLWEMLMLEGFQAGLAWITILRKREAFRSAFRGFEPARVAKFRPSDIDRMIRDPGIVRSRAKIAATIEGARAYVAMRDQGIDFSSWVWDLAGGRPAQGTARPVPSSPRSERISVALKDRGFRFVGPVIVYAWMQAVGLVNDHARTCFRRDPVRRLGVRRPPDAARR